jgi:hypothetical protein
LRLKQKARWRLAPAGFEIFRSCCWVGPLAQATAFRRHGMSMMVMMAVVKVDLHLDSKLSSLAEFVKCSSMNFRRESRA